jgi:hypothetical protein
MTDPIEPKAYEPSVSQKQADMVEHAAHDEDYRLTRKLGLDFVQGMHAANVAAGMWDKTPDGDCAKCIEAAAKAAEEGV